MHAHCKYWILAATLSATFWMERVRDGQFLIGTTGARRGWNITKRKLRICASAYLRQMVKDKLQKTKISNILYNSLGDLVELMAHFFLISESSAGNNKWFNFKFCSYSTTVVH